MARLLRVLGPKLLQLSQPMAEPTRLRQMAQAARLALVPTLSSPLFRGGIGQRRPWLYWKDLQTQPAALCSSNVGLGTGGRSGGISVRSPPEDIPYAVKGLSHIAIAVPDLSLAAEHYRSAFGAQVTAPLEKSDQGVTVVFVQLPNVCIELIHPLGEHSPVAKFLQRNPKGGIHHICLAVDDLSSAVNYLSTEIGVGSVGNSTPSIGAEGKPILFLNPKDNHGVLIELQQADQGVTTRNEGPQVVNA